MPSRAARRSDPGAPNDPDVERAFEAVPPEQIGQIVDGELVVSPRPARPHARVSSRLGYRLGPPFDDGIGGPGGWVIIDEPEIHLGPKPDKVVPDLAGWRRSRMEDSFGEDAPAFYDIAPDWVCEILSPGSEIVDRGGKMRIWRRERVGYVWLVSPALRTLEVYRLEGDRFSIVDTYEGEASIRAEPFDAIELDLPALFAR